MLSRFSDQGENEPCGCYNNQHWAAITTSTQLSATRSSCFIHSHGEAEQRFTNRSSEKLKPYSNLYQNWRFLVSLCPPQLPPVQQAAVQPAKSRLVPILPKVLHSLLGCLLRRSWQRYKQRYKPCYFSQGSWTNSNKSLGYMHTHTHTDHHSHTQSIQKFHIDLCYCHVSPQ